MLCRYRRIEEYQWGTGKARCGLTFVNFMSKKAKNFLAKKVRFLFLISFLRLVAFVKLQSIILDPLSHSFIINLSLIESKVFTKSWHPTQLILPCIMLHFFVEQNVSFRALVVVYLIQVFTFDFWGLYVLYILLLICEEYMSMCFAHFMGQIFN